MAYTFDELLIFFRLSLVDIFYVKFDFRLIRKYILQSKKTINHKKLEIYIHLPWMLMFKNVCFFNTQLSNPYKQDRRYWAAGGHSPSPNHFLEQQFFFYVKSE